MKQKSMVRRSVVLPAELLEEIVACCKAEPKSNVNRVVVAALEEYVARRKRMQFEQAMKEMASDPQIRQECVDISEDFRVAEEDGLSAWGWE